MSKPQIDRRVRITYAFIKANRNEFTVDMMCRVLGVARSGFYSWLKEPMSARPHEDARLLRLIRASVTATHSAYCSPGVCLDLREAV